MKVFCCFTKAHEVLFAGYFQPSLPADFDLHAIQVEGAGPGDFLSPEFLACIRRKMDLVIQSIEENHGEVLLWSDVDIVFLDRNAAYLEGVFVDSAKQILFQAEGRHTDEVNTGFIVLRANKVTADFFRNVRDRLLANPQKNEQAIVNEMLREGHSISWGRLPYEYYARTHGWPAPRNIRIYHANYTLGKDGIGQKIRQFHELRWIRRCGPLAVLYFSLGKIPSKLKRMLHS